MCTALQDGSMDDWLASSQYKSDNVDMTIAKFYEITNLLLERPNLNSSHLFRADILYDSASTLQSMFEKENVRASQDVEKLVVDLGSKPTSSDEPSTAIAAKIDEIHNSLAPCVSGWSLTRTVVRRLIPRKPQVDRPLEQSCFIYIGQAEFQEVSPILVVYVPHVTLEEQIPWYHPRVESLAYQYQHEPKGAVVSVHYRLFSTAKEPLPDRLHRTLLSLLQTFVRLSKFEVQGRAQESTLNGPISLRSTAPAALRDTILPQHVVQDTYSRLKQTYASNLISRWVEKTEPSKHVFEDLSIAAFLIELWKTMYHNQPFPGFVDIACGNGVLVYILIKEGYTGKGFDARRRKTWEVLGIDGDVEEKLCIAKPFLDALDEDDTENTLPGIRIHDGIFDPGTFIISNHADELTPWTPLLASLSCRDHPLPFLVIPCCSHALSGAKHRYSIKDVDAGPKDLQSLTQSDQGDQPAAGDLRAMRNAKAKAASHNDDKSAYACLTKKTVALAEELGFETDMTLMRIPSTRNIGIVGNRHLKASDDPEEVEGKLSRILERECAPTGGISESAKTWVERAKRLVEGQGRGKVNLGGKQRPSVADDSPSINSHYQEGL